MDASSTRRRRGAQPGNDNAARHGLYSRTRLGDRLGELVELTRESGSLTGDVAFYRAILLMAVANDPEIDLGAIAAMGRAIVAAEVQRRKDATREDRAAATAAIDVLFSELVAARDAQSYALDVRLAE